MQEERRVQDCTAVGEVKEEDGETPNDLKLQLQLPTVASLSP